ncbi:MAG: hypothetical protein ACOYMN_07070 [Roseimicrobium sp.]
MARSSSSSRRNNQPDVPKLAWLTRRLVFSVLAGLVVLAVILIAAGRPLYRMWSSHEARQLAEKAEAHMVAGRVDDASRALSKAYRYSPTEPAVLRLVARSFQGPNGAPEKSLHFWRTLVKSGSATASDRAEMGRAQIAAGQIDEARQLLSGFTAEERKDKTVLELEADVLRRGGDVAQADLVLRNALRSQPDNAESVLRLATMDLVHPFTEVKRNAVATVWSVARGTGKTALQAIETLAATDDLTEPQARELLERLQAHPTAKPRLRYTLLSVLISLRPAERQPVFDRETEALRGKAAEDTADLLHWFVREKEYDRVVRLVPEERALKVPALLPAYIEALAGLRRWQELKNLLNSSGTLNLSPTAISLLHARCSYGLGDKPELIRAHIEEACRRALAARDIDALQRALAISLRTVGDTEQALAALKEAAQLPQLRTSALEALLAAYTYRRDADAMLATLKDVVQARPGRTHLEALIYLKLLLGNEIESVTAQLPELAVKERISAPAASFLSALAAFRAGQRTELRDKVVLVDASKLSTGQRAVLAAMLQASGDVVHAFAIAETISQSTLLPEEARMLQRAL